MHAPPPQNESQNASQSPKKSPEHKEANSIPPGSTREIPSTQEIEDGDEDMELEEQDLAGVDLDHLEHAYRHQKLYTIPRDQLRKVHKVFLNSSAGSSARASKALGIQGSQTKHPSKSQKDEKK